MSSETHNILIIVSGQDQNTEQTLKKVNQGLQGVDQGGKKAKISFGSLKGEFLAFSAAAAGTYSGTLSVTVQPE